MYHDRTACLCDFFVGKIYGSKGYPQRNAAHMGSISLWISFAASIFFAHKKRTTPRCSIMVHVFRGAAIWAAFLCRYPLLHPHFLPTKNAQRHAVLSWYMYSGAPPSGQHFFVDILCCIHIFCPQKTHNATLFYHGTCIQGRRHLGSIS